MLLSTVANEIHMSTSFQTGSNYNEQDTWLYLDQVRPGNSPILKLSKKPQHTSKSGCESHINTYVLII